MSEKQFVLYEHKENYYILKNPRIHLDFIEMLGDALTSEEIVEELNQLNDKVVELEEENERLRNQLERKTILLKIRTKHIDDREKSFHELLNYLESFCYKSNIYGNYAKQDIINILNNWEIREYD